MDNEILKLYYDYCKSNKMVDKSFVEKVIPLIISEKQLSNYVSNFYISNEIVSKLGGVTGASYNAYDKEITIYLEGIKNGLFNRNCYDYLFDRDNVIYYYNAMFLQNILHEFQHATQIKNLDERKFNLENKILYLSLFPAYAYMSKEIMNGFKANGFTEEEIDDFLYCKRKLYYAFYQFDPSERLAEIRAFDEMFDMLKNIGIQNFIIFESIIKKRQYLRGYKNYLGFIISPTLYYLNKTCSPKDLKTFAFYSNNKITMFNNILNMYLFKDRLLYGLPLSVKEYKKILH